jgi:kelch-like protein 12
MTRRRQKRENKKNKEKKKKQGQKKKKEKKEKRDWTAIIFRNALYYLCYYLDRYGFAALETLSPSMQEYARTIIRARNEKLPEGKRIANLQGPFSVSEVYKELLQREGRHPLDIISIGGCMDKQIVNTVMSLDLVTMRCTTLTPMIYPRQGHASVVLDGKLFVIGGVSNRIGYLSSVECLDLETGQRSEMAPMITPRSSNGAAVLEGKIYVAGGWTGSHSFALVDSFDAATNQWTAVAPMNTCRSFYGMVSAQGKLFAVGGVDNQDDVLSSVEMFDPNTGEWTDIQSLIIPRYGLAVAVLGDKLYAIGGKDSDGVHRLGSVECLDLSVPNSQWTTVAPMTTPRCAMGAVVTGGKIYVTGGYGLRSIECFDPTVGPAGRWTVVSETSQFCNHAGLLVC